MRVLINLLVITALPFLLVPENNFTAENVSHSCSGDYNICLQYPSSLEPLCEEDESENGITLINADSSLEVIAYQAYNLYDWNVDQIIHFNLSNYREMDDSLQILSAEIQDLPNHAVLFSFKGYTHYQQIFLEDGKYIVLNVSQRDGDPGQLMSIASAIQLEHRA